MRFKTGEPVIDAPTVPALEGDRPTVYVAAVHRAFNSPSVYFGPFDSLDALKSWCDVHGVTVQIIDLVDPNSDPDTWWFRPE